MADYSLLVNVKSLAAEGRIIREMKGKVQCPEVKMSLRRHRMKSVKPEARCANLVYNFLIGNEYDECEPNARAMDYPSYKRLLTRCHGKMRKHGIRDKWNEFREWCQIPYEEPYSVGGAPIGADIPKE